MNRFLPILDWLPSYSRDWLRRDVIAGLTAAAVVIPQALAYATIAGLPLVVGLYTSLVALIVYAFMGTSRPLSVTTTSTLAILTAGALGQADPAALGGGASTLALLVGSVLLLASVLRLGVVANFISEPVLLGFKAGVGVVIILGQLPQLLGIHFPSGRFLHNVIELVAHLPQTHLATLVLSLALFTIYFGLQKARPSLPASLVTVVVGIAASGLADLQAHGVQLVGEVHGGLPSLAWPDLSQVELLWPAAAGIALMSFVESVAAGKAFLGPDEPRPDANRELVALGMVNVVGSMFHAMPGGGGTSQTAVTRGAGARTQVAGLVNAAVVLAVLLFLAPLVALMPKATLATVVVASCLGMIKPAEFRYVLRVRKMEFSWSIAALVGVIALGTLKGILAAVLLSMLGLALHANSLPVRVLGRKPGSSVFRPLSAEHPEDETFPGLLMVKLEGVIHFANASRVGDCLLQLLETHKPQVVAMDFSAVPDFEYTAIKMLAEADVKLHDRGVALWLVALNPEPLRVVQNSRLGDQLARERMFFTLEQAVEQYSNPARMTHV